MKSNCIYHFPEGANRKGILQEQRMRRNISAFRFHPLYACLFFLGVCGVRADDYFDPAFLNDGSGKSVDLSAFEKAGAIPEGSYLVDIYMNQQMSSTRQLRFVKDAKGNVNPELTPAMLRNMGVAVNRLEKFKNLPEDKPVGDLKTLIPASTVTFSLAKLRLDLTVPQVDMDASVAGGVDPSLWDEGVPAMMFSYNVNGSQNWMDGSNGISGSRTRSLFGNVNGGANLGAWRLRSTMTMSQNETSGGGGDNYNTRQTQFSNTYLQRDVQALRGELTMGESQTGGEVFDSIPFRGVRLVNNDDMLPSGERGFGPVVTGTARSNARVSVTQNGALIYETNVPPGPFRLTDLYGNGNGGELVVTVTEADGTKHVSTQTYSTLPVMKRPGGVDYEVTVAKYHNGGYTEGSRDPLFGLVTAKVGLPGYVTLYGGILAAQGYQSAVVGIGASLGLLGAVSLDATLARAHLKDEERTAEGESYSIKYSKNINETGTSMDLTAYRYSTRDFYTFQDAMSHGYSLQDGVAPWLGERRRSSWAMNLSQTLGTLGSIFFSGSRNDYWNSKRVVTTLGAGFSSNIKGVGYSVRYDVDQTSKGNGDWPTNRQLSLNVNVPFSIFNPSSSTVQDISATYSMTHDNHGRTSQQAGMTGSLMDSKLSWSASQSTDNQGSGNNGSAGLNWQGNTFSSNLMYGYGKNNQNVSGGVSGAVVLHPHGISLARYLGDSMALIEAPGAGGVAVMSGGSTTDSRGYGVAPYLQNYQRNVISIDPTTLPDGVDISDSSVVVYPTKGAVVEAKFKTRVGRQAMLTLNYQGKPVPFGAMVSLPGDDAQSAAIVGDSGMVYLTGAPQIGTLKVQWGGDTNQQCQVRYDLGDLPKTDKKDPNAPTVNIAQQTLTCKPMSGGETARATAVSDTLPLTSATSLPLPAGLSLSTEGARK